MKIEWQTTYTHHDTGEPCIMQLKPCTGCVMDLYDDSSNGQHVAMLNLSVDGVEMHKEFIRHVEKKSRCLDQSTGWAVQSVRAFLMQMEDMAVCARKNME